MTGHDGGAGSAAPDIHLPPPSLAPAVIALGVMLLAFGVVYGVTLMLIGLVVVVLGIGRWLIDDARAFGAAGDGPGHGGH